MTILVSDNQVYILFFGKKAGNALTKSKRLITLDKLFRKFHQQGLHLIQQVHLDSLLEEQYPKTCECIVDFFVNRHSFLQQHQILFRRFW